MPRDAASQLGFIPYVATHLPDGVIWYSAQVYSSASSTQRVLNQPRPLMRIGYGYQFPRPYHAYALHVVIAFDESTQALGPTTNVYVAGQTPSITTTEPVDINGRKGTLFELQGANGTPRETHVIGVEWQAETQWIRVTMVMSGQYSIATDDEGDDVLAWAGASKDELLRVARSASAYTGCVGNQSDG